MRRWRFESLVVVAVAAALPGCYTYHPVTPAELTPDSRVRVTVSREKQDELSQIFREPTRQFNARYVETAEDGTLLLAIPLRGNQAGMSRGSMENRLRVSRPELVEIEGRTLSRWRTGALVGAITAVVVASIAELGDGDDAVVDKDGEVDRLIKIPLHLFVR